MNKQEAIEKIKKLELVNYSSMEFVEKIIAIIDQIDEVEKEKLYTVEIPNPNVDKGHITTLKRTKDNNNAIELCIFVRPDLSEPKFQLTETEIKEDFQWAWDAGFAKEVADDTEV